MVLGLATLGLALTLLGELSTRTVATPQRGEGARAPTANQTSSQVRTEVRSGARTEANGAVMTGRDAGYMPSSRLSAGRSQDQNADTPHVSSRRPASSGLPLALPTTPEITNALATIYPELPFKGRREEIDYTLRYHAAVDQCLARAGVVIDHGYVVAWWHGTVVEDEEVTFTRVERVESTLSDAEELAWKTCAEEFHRSDQATVPGMTVADAPNGVHWVKKTVFPVRDHWLYRFIDSNGSVTE